VNGETRQSGSLSEMIWPVADVIAALSKLVTLAAGDIIFTGTPEGVGPVARGETVSAHLDGVPSLVFTME
jgi:fumarylpyruvate hydrolase